MNKGYLLNNAKKAICTYLQNLSVSIITNMMMISKVNPPEAAPMSNVTLMGPSFSVWKKKEIYSCAIDSVLLMFVLYRRNNDNRDLYIDIKTTAETHTLLTFVL